MERDEVRDARPNRDRTRREGTEFERAAGGRLGKGEVEWNRIDFVYQIHRGRFHHWPTSYRFNRCGWRVISGLPTIQIDSISHSD